MDGNTPGQMIEHNGGMKLGKTDLGKPEADGLVPAASKYDFGVVLADLGSDVEHCALLSALMNQMNLGKLDDSGVTPDGSAARRSPFITIRHDIRNALFETLEILVLNAEARKNATHPAKWGAEC